MKKIVLLLITIIIMTGCGVNSSKTKEEEYIQILNHEKYKDFKIDDVLSLSILKYTVAGLNEEKITDYNEIINTYNLIKRYKIIGESNRSCEDNTTVYQFNMKDGRKISFEFECEWLVIDNKRYNVERSN